MCLTPYLDTGRLGEVTENLRGLTLGKLLAIEINAHFDTTIGGTRERLHDGPVGEQYEHANAAEHRAAMRMARTKPTTPAGAAALVAYTRRDLMDATDPDWQMVALKTAASGILKLRALATPRAAGHKSALLTVYLNGCPSPGHTPAMGVLIDRPRSASPGV